MADSPPSSNPTITVSTSHRALPRLHSSDGITSHPKSAPMSIQSGRGESPPPPLPPPRYLDELNMGQDWQYANRNAREDGGEQHNIKPGSSLLGGHAKRTYSGTERVIDFGRSDSSLYSSSANAMLSPRALAGLAESRGESLSTSEGTGVGRGGRIPDLQALLDYNKLQGEKQMGQRSLERSQHAYDKQLLSRIGGPRTPPRSAGGHSPSASNEEIPSNPETTTLKKLNGQLRPLSLPERRHSNFDASRPGGWNSSTTTGSSSTVVSPGPSSIRSPMSEHGGERIKSKRFDSISGFSTEDSVARSTRDNSFSGERDYFGDDRSLQDLNINDRSPNLSEDYNGSRTGMKRRAASPPTEGMVDPNLRGSVSNESWQRPHQPQIAKFQHGSLSSSTSSVARSGPSSFGAQAFGQSNPSTAATSYTSDAGFQRPENSASSMSAQPPQQSQQQQQQHQHQQHQQQQQHHHHHQQQQQQQHQAQQQQQTQTQTQTHAQHSATTAAPPPAHISTMSGGPPPIPHRRTTSSGIPRAPGLWICDCCPKKPKKFESEEELRIHEMEKQYVCQYCNNRFKNKNEAERHQNSLHLRRHSWSCAALTSFEAAFHPTPQTNVTASLAQSQGYPPPPNSDTCGYCGMEFANPPNWDDRVEHLNHIHKFGECNQSKKFFRADHFRQHLKHSHAGASGKWTNVLENACMKDEPPPQPINMQQMSGMQGIQPAMHQGSMNQGMMMQQNMGAPMAPMMGSAQHPGEMRRINEMREEQ